MASRSDLPRSKKASRSKKQSKKKQKKQKKSELVSTEPPNSPQNNDAHDELSPVQVNLENQPLKDTEPETYHIYATSDQSDAEGNEERGTFAAPSGFTAVNASSRARPAKPPGQKALAASTADRNNPPRSVSAEPELAVDPSNPRPSIAATHQGDEKKSAPANTKIHEPRTNDQGRFLCPLTDEHDCKKTFADKKSAMRHVNTHTRNFVCVVCTKQMSRLDTLNKHMKLHQNSQSVSYPRNDATSAESVEEIPHPKETTEAVEAAAEADELQEDGLAEYVTPPENSHFPQREKMIDAVSEPQDIADTEMTDPDVEGGHAADGPGTQSTTPPNVNDDEIQAPHAVEGAAEDDSEQQSSAPPSVFDEDKIMIEETPLPGEQLKRKRGALDPLEATPSSPERKKKRKKGLPSSPPTSVPSRETNRLGTPEASALITATQRRQNTDKIVPRLQTRQGSIDSWAQKFTPGSNLKHPTLNPSPRHPSTQRVEVIIPRTSQAGPSGSKPKEITVDLADTDHQELAADSFEKFRRKRPRKEIYATPKGKKRAEPDVEYSTPSKDATANEADASSSDAPLPNGIATSVAKRTFPSQSREDSDDQDSDAQDDDVQRNSAQDNEEDSDVYAAPVSDSEAEAVDARRPVKKQKLAKRPRRTSNSVETLRLECSRCHRMFPSQVSLDGHLRNPSSHTNLLKCTACTQEFWARTALVKHEKETGHGKGNGHQGRTGPFSDKEVTKLKNYRDEFCDYHDISVWEFNEMMAATLERGRKNSWRWGFIKLTEFLNDFINVLPKRNKRSMLRYRERNFQNAEGMANWTADDDKDLIRLQRELGSKWAEIARSMGRTADAVSQRWRHKLRYQNVQTGDWSQAEKKKFVKVLEEVRRDSNGGEVEDFRIPWVQVSEKMGTRSAQQCSNHYRALHSKKSHGNWVKPDELEKANGSSQRLRPNKMEKRLSGDSATKDGPKKKLSDEFVHSEDEDEEDESGREEQPRSEESENDDSEADAAESAGEEEEGEGSEEPSGGPGSTASELDSESHRGSPSPSDAQSSSGHATHSRNPLSTKTPGKILGSSQLFEQTQVNTSALKPSKTSATKRNDQSSQDRPSPNIPIQHRRMSSRSPLREISELGNGELDSEDENGEDDDDEEQQAREHEISQELRTTDETSDAGDDETDQKPPLDRLEDGAIEPGTEDDASSTGTDEVNRSGSEDAVRTESDPDDNAKDANSEDDEAATSDSESSSDSNPSENVETQSADEEADSDNENEHDAQDQDEATISAATPATRAPDIPAPSFMDSIQQSAERANIKKKMRSGSSQLQTLMGLPVPQRIGLGRRQARSWQIDDQEEAALSE